MKLWALRCGNLYTDVGGLVTGRSAGAMGEVPVMCFAVDTGDGVLVFDTGLHEACCGGDPAAHFGAMLNLFEIRCPRHALVDERLRQAGYSVEDVRWVVNSHLHFDHAGRNAAFPVARQYVRARELSWAWEIVGKAAAVCWSETSRSCRPSRGTTTTSSSWRPGLTLISTPGHTPAINRCSSRSTTELDLRASATRPTPCRR